MRRVQSAATNAALERMEALKDLVFKKVTKEDRDLYVASFENGQLVASR